MIQNKNKEITSRDDDFAKWYSDIVLKSGLVDYSCVKGCMIIKPYGYSLWENIQSTLDKEFKRLGHTNVCFPLFIPESLLLKEKEHVEGFAPEVAWVTHGGQSKLEEKLCIRPTSETLFCDYFSKAVKSYRDLPLLFNQWVNVVRWEKETRPFLRTREFLWQEGHTVHASEQEAKAETLQMLNVYKDFFQDVLAIPVVVGQKSEKEKFAGAEYTYTVEALMYNGVSLQSATSHYFGQKFTKPFNIQFLNTANELENAYQTSWGTTTRIIGAIVMVHGDDNGLVLPPRIAPTKLAIIPISKSEEVLQEAQRLSKVLSDKGITNIVDNTDRSPGFKYAEHEMRGVPIRLEIGPKDLEKGQVVLARRDTAEKAFVSNDENLIEKVQKLLEVIHTSMFEKAKNRADSKTFAVKTVEEMEEQMNKEPGFIKAAWCGDKECELKVKEHAGIKSRCIPFDEHVHDGDNCCVCGKKAKHIVVWGIQY